MIKNFLKGQSEKLGVSIEEFGKGLDSEHPIEQRYRLRYTLPGLKRD
jgi:hypothetical protein